MLNREYRSSSRALSLSNNDAYCVEMKNLLLLFCFTLCFCEVQAQNDPASERKDYEAKQMLEVNSNYTFNISQADLAERFGNFSSLGISLTYKLYNNLTFTGRVSTLFGSRVKEVGMLDSLLGESEEHIDVNGNYASVALAMRGTQWDFMVGKILRTGKNPNNGIWLQAGFSYIQHRIKFEYQPGVLPQLDDDMFKGYDRLSGGGGPLTSVGYHHISANRTVSYYANWQFGFYSTQNLRGFNYDTRQAITSRRRDWVQSINLGIILPIRPKTQSKENLYE